MTLKWRQIENANDRRNSALPYTRQAMPSGALQRHKRWLQIIKTSTSSNNFHLLRKCAVRRSNSESFRSSELQNVRAGKRRKYNRSRNVYKKNGSIYQNLP